MFHHQPEKNLALPAPGKGLTVNHQFERITNRIRLFGAEFDRLFELLPF
jgi:hypothetical protein